MSTSPAPQGERRAFLDPTNLSRFEHLGMASGVVLLVSLFLPWFATGDSPNAELPSAGIGPGESANAWEIYGLLPWLLALLSLAPFILSWIVARAHKLDYPTGEVTMITGLTGIALVLCNGVILGKPDGADIAFRIGWFLALLGCVGIFACGLMRQAEKSSGRPRKPPGTV